MTALPNKPALLLVGHGSTRHAQSRLATERLADDLRHSGYYGAVAVAFLKEPPAIADALESLKDFDKIWLVPNFASHGPLTQEVIPAAVAASPWASRVVLTDPIGTSPRTLGIIERRVTSALEQADTARQDATVLLVGHGARRPTASTTRTREMAALAKDFGWAGTVHACFLEEAPWIADWESLVAESATVIVVPLLTAEGLHGGGDIPPLFGIDSASLTADSPALIGPLVCKGRTVWYWRSLGGDPEIADIVLDLTTHKDTQAL